MRNVTICAVAFLAFQAFPAVGLAQGGTIIPQTAIPQTSVPGASAGYPYSPGVGVGVVAPIQGGGAVILAPGQVAPGYVITREQAWGTGVVGSGVGPTYVVPNAGGTTILSPGYGATYIRPNPAGGTTIIGPGQPTTLLVPTQRGGSVILGPGGTGYVVPTPQGTLIQPPGDAPQSIILGR
jgi:hypothetical protein